MSGSWIAVLGASSELAAGAVRILARDSRWKFALQFRTRSAAVDSLLAELGARAAAVQADLADPEQVARVRASWVETCPQPHAILCAASPALQVRRAKEITAQQWSEQLQVQALAPALILPALLPGMLKAATSSQLLFVLSDVIHSAPKGMADYTTGKFAALGLMRALQAEFAGPKLTIQGIAPGMMETRFLRAVSPLVVEAAREKSGKLLEVSECAEKLARLIADPTALKGDPLLVV